MEITIEFDAKDIVGKLTEFGKVQLPTAANNALNLTAYQLQQTYRQEAQKVFRNVSKYTLSGFLYEKSTPETLEARVYINPDPQKGNARAAYLAPHIYGGPAYRTRFQQALSNTQDPSRAAFGGSILAPNRVMVPTQSPRGVRFNQQGNMRPGQYTQILSYLRNTDSTGTAQTGRKQARKAGISYFYMNQAMVDERRNLRNRKPGIFMRRGGRLPLMRVMSEAPVPQFGPTFHFQEIGEATANYLFPQFLAKQKFL